MGKERDYKTHLTYYVNHPEEFKNEPPRASCGTIWVKGIQEGRCTAEDMDKAIKYMRKRWVDFHLSKAKSLGLEIDADLLMNNMPQRGSNFDLW